MKIFVAAFALAIASPALAQGAPDNPHARHQAQGQHQPGQHAEHEPGQHGQHQGMQHGEGQGHAEGGCCADRDGDGRMDCCQHMAQAGEHRDGCAHPTPPAGAQPQAHQNH